MQLRCHEISPYELSAIEIRFAKIRLPETGVDNQRRSKMGFSKVCPRKSAIKNNGIREFSSIEIGSGKVNLFDLRLWQINSMKIRSPQVGITEECAFEICFAQAIGIKKKN